MIFNFSFGKSKVRALLLGVAVDGTATNLFVILKKDNLLRGQIILNIARQDETGI